MGILTRRAWRTDTNGNDYPVDVRLTIRKIVDLSRKYGFSQLYFHGHNESVHIYPGIPGDIDNWNSTWKKIGEEYICKHLYCMIPEDMQIQEILPYRYLYDDFIIPERVMNHFLSVFDLDYTRSISDPITIYQDMKSMAADLPED